MLTLAVGRTLSATPAQAKVEKLSHLVCLKIHDERNKIALRNRGIVLPDDFDENGGIVTINGEELKLPLDYFYGMEALAFAELLDAMNLDDSVKNRLISQVLPAIEKTKSGIVFKTPTGQPVFSLTNKDGFVDLEDSQFGVSTDSLLAALYAIRRSDLLDDEQRKVLSNQILDVQRDKEKREVTLEFANGTKFRLKGSDLEEKSKTDLDYQRPTGSIEHIILDEIIRACGKGAAHRNVRFPCKDDGSIEFRHNGEKYIDFASDLSRIDVKHSEYSSLKFLFDALRSLAEGIDIHQIDKFGDRPTFKRSMLNGILNEVDISVAPHVKKSSS